MPVTDVRSGRASQTSPEAIHVVDRLLGASWPSGTPRFGWATESELEAPTHGYRLVAEGLPVAPEGSDAAAAAGHVVFDTARVRVVADDRWATDDAGVGYHSCDHRLVLPGDARWHVGHPQSESWITGVWSCPVPLVSAAVLPSDWQARAQTITLGERLDSLLTEAFRALTTWYAEAMGVPCAAPGLETEDAPVGELPASAGADVSPIERETHVGAVRWLEEHVALSQGAIGELVGVSRQTVRNWLGGEAIRDENRQRLLAVRDTLERVRRRHQDPEALKTWLDTPRGPEAKTPRQLMVDGEIGKARALSLSTAPPPARSTPAWLREAPADPWTLRQRRRRERVVPDDAGSDAAAGGSANG